MSKMDLERVRKALLQISAEPKQLDPAVPPHGGTHDTDVEIADDVVKLVDCDAPDTPDLETRAARKTKAYKGGTQDDGSIDPEGKSNVDGIPVLPDTLSADFNEFPEDVAVSVDVPDTMMDELSVAPKNHPASASLTKTDFADLDQIFASLTDPNIDKAVNVLQWLSANPNHKGRGRVEAGLNKWGSNRALALEAQARYGFAYLRSEAAVRPENVDQTKKVAAWLKQYLLKRKRAIAAKFLGSADAKRDPELAARVSAWYKAHAKDLVHENKEDVGIEDITLYGPQNGAPDHRPASGSENGFDTPKVVSLEDVPFKDPKRHPAEAGNETDKQTGSPAQDKNAVDSDSFKAKNADRGKETNLPTASKTQAAPLMPAAKPVGLGTGQPPAAPAPLPEEDPMLGLPPLPGAQPQMGLPEGDPAAESCGPGMGGADMGMPPMPGGDPAAPPAVAPAPAAPGMDMAPALDLEQWLQEELMEPGHDQGGQPGGDEAESAQIEMLSSFDELGKVSAADVHMVLFGHDQENPHWNIDINGRPVARIDLAAQPKPEEARSTFISAQYAENIARAMEKIGAEDVLTAVHAKPYAAKVEAGKLAKKIQSKVEAHYKTELAAKVGELRERFLTATRIALAGYNANFFKGEDHALKAALWSELRNLGVRNAASVIEAGFEAGGESFFETVIAKAIELMDMPDAARDVIAKAIPECNPAAAVSTASTDEIPVHDTLASVLERNSLLVRNPGTGTSTLLSRSERIAAARDAVKLGTK